MKIEVKNELQSFVDIPLASVKGHFLLAFYFTHGLVPVWLACVYPMSSIAPTKSHARLIVFIYGHFLCLPTRLYLPPTYLYYCLMQFCEQTTLKSS